MLTRCPYNGGSSCVRQGGDGSSKHSHGYIHSFPTREDFGDPVGDPVYAISKSDIVPELVGLEDFFDEDVATTVLNLELGQATNVERLMKSLYDFDVTTRDGITRLLELLPIMDQEILVDLMQEIWPGYPAQESPPNLLRAEIKAYLTDYLIGKDQSR